MHIFPLLIVNLLLCTVLHIPYEYLVTPPGEMVAWLVVEEIVSKLYSHREVGRSYRVSLGG